jgi:hypothetical protein
LQRERSTFAAERLVKNRNGLEWQKMFQPGISKQRCMA